MLTNDAPPPAEAAYASQLASTVAARIVAVKAELALLEGELSGCLSVLSIARTVPMEVLSEIFKWATPAYLDEKAREELLDLVLVCQSWRNAAMGTPALWCGVMMEPCDCFEFGHDEIDYAHKEEYGKAVAWFLRSGGSPKRLMYKALSTPCKCYNGRRCEVTHPVLVRLLREGPQLDHLILHVGSVACLKNFIAALGTSSLISTVPSPWRLLRSISIVFADNQEVGWNDSDIPSRSVFAMLPPVTALGIVLPPRSNAFEDEEDSVEKPIQVPASSLERLITFSIKWDWEGNKLFGLLALCASLENLVVDFDLSEPFEDPGSDPVLRSVADRPITLAKLKSLRLLNGGMKILEYLRTPQLASLDLELNVDAPESAEVSTNLNSFLRSSRALDSLEYLRICDLIGDHDIISVALPPLPSLTHLVLDSSSACGYDFGGIEWGYATLHGHRGLCPNLNLEPKVRFRFEPCSKNVRTGPRTVYDMKVSESTLRARNPPVDGMRRVFIRVVPPV
ncbi:hypothetical protein D9611_014832 [Ephemerocybe angulata]|uniref:F-box domain-containing protein n=1 Tax=Ephemerocybe angulata TaxID=980116 RepID=A0A8H5ARA5_9AGAR|nr:hypothetical protein D9611_014657 [Tulosesus angulatus]KAF5337959.1 hypothetical protein D9611_014832 [Tulosesus angulatus]